MACNSARYGRVRACVMGHPKLRGSLPQTDYIKEQDGNKPIKEYPVNYRDFGNKEDINSRSSATGVLKPVMVIGRGFGVRGAVSFAGHRQALPHSIASPAWAGTSSALWGRGTACTQPGTHSTGVTWGNPSLGSMWGICSQWCHNGVQAVAGVMGRFMLCS